MINDLILSQRCSFFQVKKKKTKLRKFLHLKQKFGTEFCITSHLFLVAQLRVGASPLDKVGRFKNIQEKLN